MLELGLLGALAVVSTALGFVLHKLLGVLSEQGRMLHAATDRRAVDVERAHRAELDAAVALARAETEHQLLGVIAGIESKIDAMHAAVAEQLARARMED